MLAPQIQGNLNVAGTTDEERQQRIAMLRKELANIESPRSHHP
jgi:hypothetical protein